MEIKVIYGVSNVNIWESCGLNKEIISSALMQRASQQMLRFSSRVVEKSPYHHY